MRTDAPAQIPAQGAAGVLGGARALVGRQLHIVQRLVQKGRQVVDAIWRGAVGEAQASPDLGWATSASKKALRAPRQAFLLRARPLGELQAPTAETAEPAPAPPPGRDMACEFDDGDRAGIERELDRGLRAAVRDYDRLDRPPVAPLQRHVMSRPVDELIEEICEDLQLSPELLRLTEAEWAREQAAGGAEPDPELSMVSDLPRVTAVELMPCRSQEKRLADLARQPRAASP